MLTSESINELSTALAKAQGQIREAVKDAENAHFESKYASLASIWGACRDALSSNGLSVVQTPGSLHSEAGKLSVVVGTTLMHASGQWITDSLEMPVTRADAHGVGSAITYARRFALASFVGVAPGDDDAEGATDPGGAKPSPQRKKSERANTRPARRETPAPARAQKEESRLSRADEIRFAVQEIADERGLQYMDLRAIAFHKILKPKFSIENWEDFDQVTDAQMAELPDLIREALDGPEASKPRANSRPAASKPVPDFGTPAARPSATPEPAIQLADPDGDN